jgi:hypothetical protein
MAKTDQLLSWHGRYSTVVEDFLYMPMLRVWVYLLLLASREKMVKIDQLLSWPGSDSTVVEHFLSIPGLRVRVYLLLLA